MIARSWSYVLRWFCHDDTRQDSVLRESRWQVHCSLELQTHAVPHLRRVGSSEASQFQVRRPRCQPCVQGVELRNTRSTIVQFPRPPVSAA